jgi:chemotaxis response regulator CheB
MTKKAPFGKFILGQLYVIDLMIIMIDISKTNPRRVLIVSSHPLFGQGLQRLLQARSETDVADVNIVTNVQDAMVAIQQFRPDLVVVDYDDEAVNRDEFLARYVEGERKLRVVLLSLKEGGSEAIVYDRRTMSASQIDDWLKEWVDVQPNKDNEVVTNSSPNDMGEK